MKKLLIPFVVFVYLMQAYFLVLCGLSSKFDSFNFNYYLLYIPFFVFGFAALIFGILNCVFGLLQISRPIRGVYKTVMICKLALIPFFIINFIICVLLAVGMLNPFLLILGVVVMLLCLLVTYGIMLSTSVYNVGYAVYQVRQGEVSFLEVLMPVIFQFIYILDCVGAVMLYIKGKESAEVLSA